MKPYPNCREYDTGCSDSFTIDIGRVCQQVFILGGMRMWYTVSKFVWHLWQARRWDAFHSPFLFELFTYCCDDGNKNVRFARIEARRKTLLRSRQLIIKTDLGKGRGDSQQQVQTIARRALSYPFQCRFLARLATYTKPHHVLEFGTSLGISTAYLASGHPGIHIDTVEGDPAVARIAQETFRNLKCANIALHTMSFRSFIKGHQNEKNAVDMLFIDGHHTGEALLKYYQALKPRMHPGTVVVVDDLYWSPDMTKAWNVLRGYPEVTQSVDCFHFGLLFFSQDFLGLENHRIRLPFRMMFS